MKTVNIHEAKTHLSRLLKRVASGEEVVIARAGRPVARLIPAMGATQPRLLGRQKGKFTLPEDFDAPLPEETLESFER